MSSPLPIHAFQWDLARQVERLDFLRRWLPRYAEWGYQELYLHLEDAVEYPSLPGVARPDAYTYEQFAKLVACATAAGIRVVPIVNLLGHTQYLIKVPRLRELNELRDARGRPLDHGQICPLHPRLPEVADKLLHDVAPFCTTGKVHVGLDESFHLGKCPRCRAEVEQIGLAGHFSGHVRRLDELAHALGLRLGLWADMLALLPAAIQRLPRDVVAYDWYYYPFGRHPRVELRNFAEADLATPLRARGIEYWGCPMNGAFRYEPMPVFGDRLANIVSWWRRCQRVAAGGFLVTAWEPNRLALETTLAVDAAAACLWLNPEVDDPEEMMELGLGRVFGKRGRKVLRRVIAADAHPFAGYHRWQINDRWDVCAGRDGVGPYDRELAALGNVRAGLPPALHASLAFRRYLAQRDVFVRRAAQAVFDLRRLSANRVGRGSSPPGRGIVGHEARPTTEAVFARLRSEAATFARILRDGRTAAKVMWNRSRDPAVRGPNELMLDRDAERLREWRGWLRRAAAQPEIIQRSTPLCGAWQLQFTVHNFAPALQKVVIDERRPDGSWSMLHGVFLIEFRAEAARPRASIRRECSVPVGDPGRLLRIAVRGVGRVAISDLELTDGVIRLRPRGWPRTRRMVLGRPPGRRGFPHLDFATNAAAVSLKFSGPYAANPKKRPGLLRAVGAVGNVSC